jgi:hypothetical protein
VEVKPKKPKKIKKIEKIKKIKKNIFFIFLSLKTAILIKNVVVKMQNCSFKQFLSMYKLIELLLKHPDMHF